MYIVRTCWRIVLLALFGITPYIVSADIVIYTSGNGDAGQTGDFTQTYTLRDASLTEDAPDTAWGGAGNNNVQTAGTSGLIPFRSYSLLSFDIFSGEQGSKIGGDGNNINSANLFMFRNANGGNDITLTVRGLSAGASDWNEAAATWNTKDGTTGWNGAGGNIDTALSGSYGSYSFSDADSGWVSIDITDALKAYAEGSIGGIVITSDTTGGFLDRPVFSFDSKDNPSGDSAVLRVDQIPEPAVASFMLIGSAFMLVNRRTRRSEPENQTATL